MTERHIQVNVKFFAAPREALGTGEMTLSIPASATVQDLLNILVERHPSLREYMASLSVAVNRTYVSEETNLQDGDEVACLPPMAGG